MFSTAFLSIRSFCSASDRPRKLAKNGRCACEPRIREHVVGLTPVPRSPGYGDAIQYRDNAPEFPH